MPRYPLYDTLYISFQINKEEQDGARTEICTPHTMEVAVRLGAVGIFGLLVVGYFLR